jgi:hypothetical protein
LSRHKIKKLCHPEGREVCGQKGLNAEIVQNPNVEILRLPSSGSLRKTVRGGSGNRDRLQEPRPDHRR